MGAKQDKPGLGDIVAAAQAANGGSKARGLPPVHLWNPPNVGEIDIVIRKDGTWVHEGGVIGREALVRLFSTVLRRDPDGIYLVTPHEKLRIAVEDAPFVAVRVDRVEDGALRFLTNVGDEVEAGPDHPIRVETDAAGEPRPYVHVRGGLEALITRPVFYELVDHAEERATARGAEFGLASNGAWFPIGAVEAQAQ
ncbi:DUF1285 domain-containing protein [Phenylobacterium sp. LjRoot219]|uniref:DUF1285 domain-containing protein n=1 Tax=Phenylobacterium sp. LjRoot219 TaxID=3342283 RepID=UPI003ED09E97